jgi:Ca-activated chloride channel family protein
MRRNFAVKALAGPYGELREAGTGVTFERPIFLLLLLALPVVWIWARRKPRNVLISFALKSVVFAALVVALANPQMDLPMRKVAVTVLVDTSASMPRGSIQRSEALLSEMVRRNFNADIRLITFAGQAHLVDVPRNARNVVIPESVDPADGMSTDLGGAIGLALSTFPQEGARRILLVSDGNQNRGDALAAAARAKEAGVAIYTEPSGGTSRLPVLLTNISAPEGVFSGERFSVSLGLETAATLPVRLSIRSGTEEIAAKSVPLHPGGNVVDMDARITDNGVKDLEVEAEAGGAQQMLFSQAISVRRPRVLYITGDLEPSAPLLKTLKEAQVDVETAPAFPTDRAKTNWDAVVLDNYPDQPLDPPEENALEEYVTRGGGLVFIGGDKNAQLAKEPKTVLEKMLPIQGDPNPAPEQPTVLVLVLDKSLSMDGAKIYMVRQAARASVATLRPIDKVGLIAFDREYRWVVPVTSVAAATNVDALIDSITASGGTRIYPAMQAAYDAIRDEQASRKHIILLTDGVSPVDDLPQLETSAALNHVTISAIGVGDDVDRGLLEQVASTTHGRFYFIEDPEKITKIINDETRDLNNTEIVERSVRAISVRPVEFTDGIDFATAPKLLGFMKTKARDGSETILRTDTGEPLLARWEYGLGRVAAFLSDSRARWSAPWVSWHSYGTLWPQMVRDISRRDALARTGVRPGVGTADSIVYYDVSENAYALAGPGADGTLYVSVSAPDGTSQKLPLRETAPHHYEVPIQADQEGLYRITPQNSPLPLPVAGFFHQPEELKVASVDIPLLQEISRATGGAMSPSMDQLFDERGSDVHEVTPLWPYWILLALAVNFFELALRKGHFGKLISWIGQRSLAGSPTAPAAAGD